MTFLPPYPGPQLLPPSQLYNYSFELSFEKNFDKPGWKQWFDDYWYYSIPLCILYISSIYAGQKIMKEQQAFKLTKTLAYWNFALALFSFAGAIRMTPEFFYTLWNYGWHSSVCTSGYTQLKVCGFWATMFTLSKAVELVDTAFIVLRKRPLIFLHWYHHVTVLLLTWYGYADHTAPARWFVWMNYTVHAVMYTYYGMRAIGMRTPKLISVSITTMQITQMAIGCYIAYHVYSAKANGKFCQQTERHLWFSVLVYFSYLVLFVQFFYDTYLKKDGRPQRRSAPVVGKEMQNGSASENGKVKSS